MKKELEWVFNPKFWAVFFDKKSGKTFTICAKVHQATGPIEGRSIKEVEKKLKKHDNSLYFHRSKNGKEIPVNLARDPIWIYTIYSHK